MFNSVICARGSSIFLRINKQPAIYFLTLTWNTGTIIIWQEQTINRTRENETGSSKVKEWDKCRKLNATVTDGHWSNRDQEKQNIIRRAKKSLGVYLTINVYSWSLFWQIRNHYTQVFRHQDLGFQPWFL